MDSPRFIVTELEGFLHGGNYARSGLSVTVLDTAVCYRMCGEFRSEDYGGTMARRFAVARHRGQALAARLNGEAPPEPPEPLKRTRDVLRCPHCRARNTASDVDCIACGRSLTEHGNTLTATCRNGHPRTAANTYYRADGRRECRLCRRAAR